MVNTREALAKLLKEKRCVKGLSLLQVAKMLGVSTQTVSSMEKQKSAVRFVTVMLLIQKGVFTFEELDQCLGLVEV